MAKKEITEQIVQKKLSELHPFKDHPFKVVDDELMQQTVDSILSVGVLTPLIVREDKDGGYEILSGHRRLHACEILGMDTVPVIVKQLDDDAATIFMVDSNLQRENILPSERALAYKMKMDALKRQGERSDLTSDQVGPKLWAAEKLAQDTGESATQIKRYIRLSNLVPELKSIFDENKAADKVCVESFETALIEHEEKNMVTKKLQEAIDTQLTETQKRRLYMSFFRNMTAMEIAKLEGVSFSKVCKSIRLAKKKSKNI